MRLLTVLSETEPQVRRGGNPRLAVELLLLRWAMMDQTVEIGEVLNALKGVGTSESRIGGSKPEPPTGTVLRDVAPPAATPPAYPHPATRPSDQAMPAKGPLTLERLRTLWPSIVAYARGTSPMFGTLLAATEVAGIEGSLVTLRLLDQTLGQVEGIDHKRDALAKLVGEYVTESVRIRVEGPGARDPGHAPPAAGSAPRPHRLTEQSANAERLKVLRAKDPTLSAAVDALDLELLE